MYFVTQNPLDVPDTVLGQLGNRVQHALRAFTPRDQKAVKAAADTMRANPAIGDMATAITELAVGEALVSFLDAKGRPSVTERVFVLPPGSQIGPITPAQRQALIKGSLVAGRYEKTEDRESAYEKLKGRAVAAADTAAAATAPAATAAGGASRRRPARRAEGHAVRPHRPARRPPRRAGRSGGLVGGAQHRLGGRPRDRARRARVAAGRAPPLTRSRVSAGLPCQRPTIRCHGPPEMGRLALPMLPLLILGAGQLGALSGQAPTDLGVRNGRLKAPSNTPNSVSSQADLWPGHPQQASARIPPIELRGGDVDGQATLARVRDAALALPGAALVEQRPGYLYLRFTTRWLKFVDDAEFWFDPQARVIQVRSASRIGSGDLGVNRARVEAIRAALAAP